LEAAEDAGEAAAGLEAGAAVPPQAASPSMSAVIAGANLTCRMKFPPSGIAPNDTP
jgi:hypothetical protein